MLVAWVPLWAVVLALSLAWFGLDGYAGSSRIIVHETLWEVCYEAMAGASKDAKCASIDVMGFASFNDIDESCADETNEQNKQVCKDRHTKTPLMRTFLLIALIAQVVAISMFMYMHFMGGVGFLSSPIFAIVAVVLVPLYLLIVICIGASRNASYENLDAKKVYWAAPGTLWCLFGLIVSVVELILSILAWPVMVGKPGSFSTGLNDEDDNFITLSDETGRRLAFESNLSHC